MYPTNIELCGGEIITRKNSKIQQDCEKYTKNFIDKLHVNKLAKCETYVFTESTKIKRVFIFTALLVLFISSLYGSIFMWCTDGFAKIIYSNIAIEEDSSLFEMWRKPTVKPLIKIYIYNYTNVENYENEVDSKLNIEEKGPYVYEESMERVNVKFNGTFVSFRMKRNYRFVAELSKGRQNDILTVPNMLLLAVAGIHKDSSFITRLTISKGLEGFYSSPFHKLAADRMVMGYEDQLYALSKSVMVFQNKQLADKLGLLSQKIGVSRDTFTVHTGKGSINDIGKIVEINGKSQLNYWTTNECNSLDASDGTLFSPDLVRRRQPLRLFTSDLSRTVPMLFQKESSIYNGEIPTLKYVLPENVFDSAENHSENQCFCELDGGTCPLQGVHNITQNFMGAPTFVSFPHFYRGDASLLNGITGLNPNGSLHETFVELHPTLGFPVAAATRMQLNMQIVKSYGFSLLDKYENGLMLPLAWFELSLDETMHSKDATDLIEAATHTVLLVEKSLKFGFVMIFVLTAVPLLANVIYRFRARKSVLVLD